MLLLLQHLKRCPNPRLVGRKLKTETEKDLHYYHYHYYPPMEQPTTCQSAFSRVPAKKYGYPSFYFSFIFSSLAISSYSITNTIRKG